MFAKYMMLDDEWDASHPGQPWLDWKRISEIGEVLDAFAKLDGDRYSMLVVSENPPPGPGAEEPFFAKALSICGGKDDQYVCEAYIENEYTAITLCDPDVSNSHEYIDVKCGQLESFARYLVARSDMVRRALVAFVETGRLSEEFTWERV